MLDLTHERLARAGMSPDRFAFITGLLGKALALGYKLTRKDRYDNFCLERVHGTPILVTPSVFNPKRLRSGEFLASQIDSKLVPATAEVLDLGTGSGLSAICAARYARRVTAVDINAAAVRCAGINALVNHLEHKIDVRHGDLFGPVSGQRFDLILFNPPFLRGKPNDDRDRAWRSTDVAERFAAGLGGHLEAGGCALLLLSTFGDAASFLHELGRHGFEISVLARRRFVNERLAIFKLRLSQPERAT